MNVQGNPTRSIWSSESEHGVWIIDQTRLPHKFHTIRLHSVEEAAHAIRSMQVRGAPLIGATAAYGIYLAMQQNSSDDALEHACQLLLATRPTAINLCWAIDRVKGVLLASPIAQRSKISFQLAEAICDEDIAINRQIAIHGLSLLQAANAKKNQGDLLNILTHCNAGWLATVDWGTALAPIYAAYDMKIPVHVWVDETRPRNQGASLTAWELAQHGVPHTVIADNTGGHLMQQGLVDLCIVGTDRTTAQGDVANKIGTYLKALAAFDNQIPFYVALPSPSLDTTLRDGLREIPIEQRDPSEVTQITGCLPSGDLATVRLTPWTSRAANYSFDVTPARLITALITERGICPASEDGLRSLFPERFTKVPW